MTTATPSKEPLPRGKRWLFVLLSAVVPVLVLVLVEGGLRLAGFGREPEPLFIPDPSHPEYLLANPRVITRYFADPEQAPQISIETVFFRGEKSPDTFRIVVQGGSTAAGFPYGLGASPAGMLEQRLRRTFPRRDIEVIQTAMAAVNSYALLDFADEIIAQDPDLVLIYAGHNEFLGISGVGSALSSSHSRMLTLLIQKLRHLRFYQLLERFYTGLRGDNTPESRQGSNQTLMARVAGEKQIPYESGLYLRGIEQFRANLSDLLSRYRAAGIPVMIANLASNERDQAPFVSGLDPDTDRELWEARYAVALDSFERGDYADAVVLLEELVALDDGSADAHYAYARALDAAGHHEAAREAFRAAKDRDQLRFRASEHINDVIRALGDEYDLTVVDVRAALAGATDHGIIGNDLMLEHLHPNLDGYFLLADAFYDAMREQELIGSWEHVLPDEQARREIPVSELDRLFGEYKVLKITAGWPFEDPPETPEIPTPSNPIERIAHQLYEQKLNWPQAQDNLRQLYKARGDDFGYTRVSLMLADGFPFMAAPQYEAGVALIGQGRHEDALRYLHRAATLEPRRLNHLLALSHAFVLNEEWGKARQTLERVLALDPDNPTATRVLGQLAAKGGEIN